MEALEPTWEEAGEEGKSSENFGGLKKDLENGLVVGGREVGGLRYLDVVFDAGGHLSGGDVDGDSPDV